MRALTLGASMKHLSTAAVAAAGLALAVLLPASSAQALNTRSFVSGHGSDANACTLAAPCRTLAVAFAQTSAGGEIDVLDAAGYGALTIDKAISIINDGVGTAAVLVPSGGTGITINAGASDVVSLRGLTVDGTGTGTTGIQFNSGKFLSIENCVIRNVTDRGIKFDTNLTISTLSVSKSLIENNNVGISISPGIDLGTVRAVISRSEVNNNAGTGIVVSGSNSASANSKVKATVYDSVVARNGFAGIFALTSAIHSPTTVMVFHSVVADNAYGLRVDGVGATMRAGQTMVTGNGSGWFTINSGVLQSYTDNYIDGNDSDETAPPTTARK